MTKIPIIGSGLCGLSVVHFLKDRAKITLFKKALGVSSRMSTRRVRHFIQPLISQGIIER
jgi:predicted NAD/FAD-dependent oxidoreductase